MPVSIEIFKKVVSFEDITTVFGIDAHPNARVFSDRQLVKSI